MEKIDVGQIKEEEVPDGAFPAACPRSDFRVHFAPEAHRRILAHSRVDTGIELCGVMVGQILKDRLGPFALVEDIIRGEHAENHGAQVTFTQATWAHIFAEMDRSHSGRKIVGWYHTHPGFGIFLSPMDMFIQQNFFNLPWQTAFVADPLSGDEGLFVWRDGKPAPAAHYWIGNEVRFARQRPAPHRENVVIADPALKADPPPAQAAVRWRSAAWDVAMVVLLSGILLLEAAIFFAGSWDKLQEKLKDWRTPARPAQSERAR